MFNRSIAFASAVLTTVVVAGCSRQPETVPCVATATVATPKDRAAIGSPLKMTYKFQVAQPVPEDYVVFVHVLDDQGDSLWGDDHQPPQPTSTWKPGQTVEYTRTVFVQNYPYIGPAHVRIGLYQPSSGQRLPLCNTEFARHEYEVLKFQLLAQSENIFLIYKDGWHPAEVAPDTATEWQWTKKAATISFKNPKKDSTFYLEYDARIDQFSPAQQVTIRSGSEVIGTFAADSKTTKLVSFPVTAAQLGDGDMAEITIDVDKVFAPGGSDPRELGIRVFHAFIEPN